MNTATKETAAPGKKATAEESNQQPKDATPAANGKPIDMAALGLETVEDYFHAPTETFLVRNDAGRWLQFRAASYKRLLIHRGMNGKAGKGEAMAETDLEIVRVQTQNDVSFFGPLCGRNAGFYEENGMRLLVTEDMALIQPEHGDWPMIRAVLRGLLCDSETKEIGDAQLHTFCGWLKSSAEALRAKPYARQQQQQALAICGVADCGKSLIQHHIVTPCLAGRSADGDRYFLRDNDFNANLYKAEHLFLDDCRTQTRIGLRLAFAGKIKSHTVGATIKGLHGKGKDEVNVAPWWRITITLNDDPESLLILPPLDENFEDKLILLRASRFDFPEPINSAPARAAFVRKLHAEIPAFLHWLLNSYQIPEQYADPRRYSVATFHHPELKEALEGLSPEAELLELIDGTLDASQGKERDLDKGIVWIQAEALETAIRFRHQRRADKLFTFNQACAKYLHRLSVKHPERVAKHRQADANGWNIFPKPPKMEGVEGDY